MRAVDTNVLVRLIAQDDLRQVAIAEEFIEQGAWVSLLAFAETIWVLSSAYARRPEKLAEYVEMLLNHNSLVIQHSDLAAAALSLFRAQPSLSFSDCLLVQLARSAGHLPLGTFDRKLAKVEGTRKL